MPLQEPNPNAPLKRSKPVPKPKALEDRVYKPSRRIQRPEASYSRGKKLDVLKYIAHEKVFVERTAKSRTSFFRPVRIAEAAAHFRIPRTTVSSWVKQSEKIIEDTKRSDSPR